MKFVASLTYDSVVVSVVIIAWQTAFVSRHFPSRGHNDWSFVRQLLGCYVGVGVLSERIVLMCDEIMNFMLGMQEKPSFSACLLKNLRSG